MKTRSLIGFVLTASALMVSSNRAADAPGGPVDSKITAVVVYTDRAVVTRSAELKMEPGLREVRFERLPSIIADGSLQVTASGTADSAVIDVAASQTFVGATPDERIKALEDEIAALQRQVRVLTDRATLLNEQREFVKGMLAASTTPAGPTAPGSAAARPTLESWQKLYEYSEGTLGRIATELQSIDIRQHALTASQSALEQQLAQLRGAGGRSYKTVVIRLSTARAGDLKLDLAYGVPNASWAPSYDARIRTAQRTVELSYHGVLRQGTGEDWENVALTLSTSQPSLGGGPPALPAAVVDVVPETRQTGGNAGQFTSRGFSVVPAGSNVTQAGSTGFQRDFYQSNAASADSFGLGFNSANAIGAVFRIATPVSLPSDNSTQRVSIAKLNVPSELRYEAMPKMREAAFLAAPAINATEYPLLTGPMNTFLDDTFVATGTLAQATSGERFELLLGADDGIGIKRKLVNRFTEDTGISGRNRRTTYEVLVTVTNFKKTPEEVRFREAVPVSRDERIVVRLLAPLERDIGPYERIKEREVVRETEGLLIWRLALKPGEKREITLKYSVEHPADLAVTGLE